MNEIKCPKCGEIFQVDEAGYAAIVKQVRDKEFNKELQNREKQFEDAKNSAVQVAVMEKEKDLTDELNKKNDEIAKLQLQITTEQNEKQNAVKDIEIQKNKEMSELQHQNEIEINKIKEQLNSEISDKKEEIAELKNKIDSFEKDKTIEINEILNAKNAELAQKDIDISQLKSEKELIDKNYQLKENELITSYEKMLVMKQEEIENYKDLKAKLSTKMIGETLEQHCQNEFNKWRSAAFQTAKFGKDNEVKEGTKGDYIFRDFYDNDKEFISIMFEMKNESDTTSTKKKNEDFLDKLDKDRNKKGCEYAVLVSLLEPDNEYYNSGIVDMSHEYPKMYVIRPQFFIPMITLLRNAALNSVAYHQELLRIKAQNIDITNFESELALFKDRFLKNVKDAKGRFDEAIKGIDDAIKVLENIKESLRLTEKHLHSANNKVDDLTVKKLTKNNPTMLAKFKELEDKQK